MEKIMEKRVKRLAMTLASVRLRTAISSKPASVAKALGIETQGLKNVIFERATSLM